MTEEVAIRRGARLSKMLARTTVHLTVINFIRHERAAAPADPGNNDTTYIKKELTTRNTHIPTGEGSVFDTESQNVTVIKAGASLRALDEAGLSLAGVYLFFLSRFIIKIGRV